MTFDMVIPSRRGIGIAFHQVRDMYVHPSNHLHARLYSTRIAPVTKKPRIAPIKNPVIYSMDSVLFTVEFSPYYYTVHVRDVGGYHLRSASMIRGMGNTCWVDVAHTNSLAIFSQQFLDFIRYCVSVFNSFIKMPTF